RVPAPATTRTGRSTAGSSPRSDATWSSSPAGAVTTSASTAPDAHRRRAACTTSGRPSSSTRALGRSIPRRVPEPAAVRTARVGTGTRYRARRRGGRRPCGRRPPRCPCRGPEPGTSGGQHLVEDRLGLLLLGVLRQRELRDEDLASLREHALLAGRQPAVRVPAGEVAHDLRHLDHVARRELLEVRLVPARPVGRLLGVGCTQHLEHAVEALLADDVTHADEVDVLGWDFDGQVALRDLELEVDLVLSADGARLDLLDQCGSVVRVDNGLAYCERHLQM